MKHLRLLAFTSTAFFVAYGGMVACSDDTVVTPAEAGTEAGTDAPIDSPVDSPADAPDTGPPLTSTTFAQALGEAMCESLARCCYGNAMLADDGGIPDGGNFKRTNCRADLSDLGFEGSNLQVGTIPPANVNVDQAKAAECLQKIRALTCTTGGAEFASARASCFAALSGKGANGSTCTSPLQCGSGSFCLLSDAGTGSGTCQPLRGDGGLCSDHVQHIAADPVAIASAEEACSYRRGGTPALRCENYDYTNDVYLPRDQWRCKPTVAAGGRCNYSNWCSNELCNSDPTYVCVPTFPYFGPICANYR